MSRSLVCIAMITALAGDALAGTPAPQVSSADPLLAEASEAVASASLAEYSKSAEQRIKPLLTDLQKTDVDQLTRLAALRDMARFFARIEKPDPPTVELIQWLIQHPILLDTLMLAVSDADAPDRVLAVLAALREQHDQQLEDYADLTTAMCVVWDTPQRFDPENPRADTTRPVWLFKYLVSARERLRSDPMKMPWELAIYVVDNPVSQDDVAWALRRYAQRGAIGGAYFDVPYDLAAFYGTADKAIGAHEYTLPNLARYGGICSDQAYFATQVARSLGIPACVCAGMGGASEVGHAWVGYLESRGHGVVWNFSEGRYPEHLYWKGAVQDPQTRAAITDSDVSLLAELTRTSARSRLASRAMCRVADLAASARAADVYTRAIDLSPGNRNAWMSLAQLGANLNLSERQFAQVTQVVATVAAKSYPDFAFAVLQKLNSGRGTEQQILALKQARAIFNRPDLLASIRLAEGDLLRNQQQPAAALAAYGEVLTRNHHAGPIVLAALDRIEDLLRANNELRRLASIYAQAWQRLPQPTVSAYARSTPYYLVGQKYRSLLEELGESSESQRVRARLDSITSSRASP